MSDVIDIFKNALAGEVRTRAFYDLASEVTEDDQARTVFIELAAMEEHHGRELVEVVRGTSIGESWDAAAYLDELEDNIDLSLSELETATINDGDMRAVLEIARDIESRARDTYRSLAEHADNDVHRQHFTHLADQEAGHLQQVERLLLSLDMADDDRASL